ncbi:MAG: flagellar hook-basal body complex protein [Acetobacteraceae bacterium]
MDLASTVALSRMDADMRAMNVTANNIANASTPGFKAEAVQFTDWLSRQTGAATPPGGATIAFAQDRATWRDTAPGTLTHTANPLDLGLGEAGYFTVETPRGPRLTRDGRFGLMPNGTIADAAGEPLLDVSGKPIRLSPADTNLSVAGDGTLSSENGRIGRIGVVRPQDPRALTAEGATLMRADTPTAPSPRPRIVQGAVEDSNVAPVTQISRMLDQSRQFSYLGAFLQAEADRERTTIDKLLPTPQGG